MLISIQILGAVVVFFFTVALALTKANFVSRNIGLKQISHLRYCRPCIQFSLSLVQSQKSWRKLTGPSFRFGSKVENDREN